MEYENNLATYVEILSDEFGSTFSVVDENTLANMLGFDGDFDRIVNIMQDQIPGIKLEFIKTGQLGDDPYDIYIIKQIEEL